MNFQQFKTEQILRRTAISQLQAEISNAHTEFEKSLEGKTFQWMGKTLTVKKAKLIFNAFESSFAAVRVTTVTGSTVNIPDVFIDLLLQEGEKNEVS